MRHYWNYRLHSLIVRGSVTYNSSVVLYGVLWSIGAGLKNGCGSTIVQAQVWLRTHLSQCVLHQPHFKHNFDSSLSSLMVFCLQIMNN